MILECDYCGRPLGAADVVGESRRCVGCSGPVGPHRPAAQTDPALVAARAAWQAQTNAHKQRLGLNGPQRAALTGALLGRRSLWACTPAELYEQIAVLESLQSAAEVDRFIYRQQLEGGT
ncbi:MAG: hypothetical protein M3Z04_14005 [Chloroflexota bacterium]|nr:hypothetical protein [Chloroflexota bacterium]